MKMIVVEPIAPRLARAHDPDEVWLWCSLCERFFQYKHARERDACPFADCHGHGIGFEIMWWDDMREPEDPRWPASTDELAFGMASPDMKPFYEARVAARIDAMVSAFAASPELASALGGQTPRYLRPFLKMMSDLYWDLTDEDEAGFSEFTAQELIGQLPVWSRTADLAEAPIMAAELRAFFAFAARTAAVKDAAAWLALVNELDLDDIFRDTMQTDRRLRPARPRPQPCARPRPWAPRKPRRQKRQKKRRRRRR